MMGKRELSIAVSALMAMSVVASLGSCRFSAPPDECLSQVSVASWNIRLFSNSSRTDEQIETIAGIVSQFDLVVIQELLDLAVLDRVLDQLTGLGKTYDVVVSPIV